jgi:threonine/homoserine/homoserine lactone efflux protein
VRTWFESPADLGKVQAPGESRAFWRGVLLAVVNPKTLLFNAAFLPQFLSGAGNAGYELFLITGVFLSVIFVGDSLWALFATSARAWLACLGTWRNRITSIFLVGAGAALALSRRNV